MHTKIAGFTRNLSYYTTQVIEGAMALLDRVIIVSEKAHVAALKNVVRVERENVRKLELSTDIAKRAVAEAQEVRTAAIRAEKDGKASLRNLIVAANSEAAEYGIRLD